MPKASFSRSGGQNNGGIGLKEMNLLGTGAGVEVMYRSDVDRDSAIVRYFDNHVGNSWYRLQANYASSSDGHTYLLGLSKPFYALDTRNAHGISFLDNEEIESLYDRGKIVGQFQHFERNQEAFLGWSSGLHDGWTRRYTTGLVLDEHRFLSGGDIPAGPSQVPEDRRLVYPFVGIEFVEDRFETTSNLDHIDRTEDRFLGTRAGVRLGAATRAFGSDRDAWIVQAGAQTGFGTSRKNSLVIAGNMATRIEDGGLENFVVDVSARYHRRQSERRLLYASLSGTFGQNLDIDNPLLLGGDTGLRGYPLRYQTGDKRMLFTIEQRYFTDWYPFRLFRVGGAVFFDAGRAWGDSPVATTNNEILKDVGFGLRIGNTRSGEGRMTHIDLAFPLDGDEGLKDMQLVIETKKSF
jgi:hypothetical protein